MEEKLKIGIILFPDFTQLDLTAPYEVFSRMPGSEIYLISGTLSPVRSERGLSILPDTLYEDCPVLDVIFLPGGAGITGALQNEKLISFLKSKAATAKYITSVCTGSLVLASAGLLNGYSATTHWLSLDLLRLFKEVKVTEQRVVIDRNRITGSGITAGIDFALSMAKEIYGEDTAKEIQLMLEYNPQPPFDCGYPNQSNQELVSTIKEKRRHIQLKREKIIKSILSENG